MNKRKGEAMDLIGVFLDAGLLTSAWRAGVRIKAFLGDDCHLAGNFEFAKGKSGREPLGSWKVSKRALVVACR